MSNAVGAERVAKVVGYEQTSGDFSEQSPNLPMRIVLLAEANDANQATLDTNPKENLSLQQCGKLYGYGSPVYINMRILKPVFGGILGGLPIVVMAQEKAPGATPKILEITPTGTATGNGTHTVVICGRNGVDGDLYEVNIAAGDTPEIICTKMISTISKVLGSPVIATNGTGKVVCRSKWSGLTADEVNIYISTNGNSLGVTYAVSQTSAGAGTPSIDNALKQFGNTWNTIISNSYGTVPSILNALETFNGRPDPVAPTGRYAGIIMKPFIAVTGSLLDDPSIITDSRSEENTIAIAPAPKSLGLSMEAAANLVEQFARQAQDSPHLDVSGKSYRDMPTPLDIGSMADYNNRDSIVKKGCSTVDLVGGKYVINDFITTYHKQGENPPSYRYCRSLIIDWNIRFTYYLKELVHVADHAIVNDDAVVNVDKVVKPKQWKQIVSQMADEFEMRALITHKKFMIDSISVKISPTNPDRLGSFFRYKRSSFARILSTTAQAGFNYGPIN
jgi:phage tail sheath gpL-like